MPPRPGSYEELKVKYYNPCCHKNFLRGILVTTYQLSFVAYLNSFSASIEWELRTISGPMTARNSERYLATLFSNFVPAVIETVKG
jgi:hypothetical protein